jgi:hypothetical protein
MPQFEDAQGRGDLPVGSAGVIARLDRATQYSRIASDLSRGRGVLDPPLSRRMTIEKFQAAALHCVRKPFSRVEASAAAAALT